MAFTVDKQLKQIISDKTSGSTDILLSINNYLLKKYDSSKNIKQIISFLLKEFTTFEIVQQYLKKCLAMQKKSMDKLGQLLKDYELIFHERISKLIKNCYRVLKNYNVIITISNSKTILAFLEYYAGKNKNLEVIISESRPKFEGRILAKKLLEKNINVQLITEAMIPEVVKKIDCALIGADAILKNYSVVNKMGSKSLAFACKYYKKPFYVLADKNKFKMTNQFEQTLKNKKEIWTYEHPHLFIENLYFEEIPKSLITRIISN
ncbi:hypothetical protein ABRY23_08815 [Melioribacteraceae bacterium 4301-Me]|uniref:hypothetical protein n=1 Tax=Pyranulibacter aquaticus TaxID=3163344 RepID=UPI00359716E8